MKRLKNYLILVLALIIGELTFAEDLPTVGDTNSKQAVLSKNSVNSFYGRFDTEVPINVPSFHSITPEISLQYSSDQSNGLLGVGWSIGGLSKITRVSQYRGVPNFDN